jgi:hypothetical protein
MPKNWAGGVAQGEGPEFKPQQRKKKQSTHLIFFFGGNTAPFSQQFYRSVTFKPGDIKD